MEHTKRWTPSVTELVRNFRDAVVALVSPFERAKIPWRSPQASEPWEDVIAALYEGLLIEDVRAGVPEAFQPPHCELRFPRYLVSPRKFESLSFFEVNPGGRPDRILVFSKFETDQQPFDTVACDVASSAGVLTQEPRIRVPQGTASFTLRVRTSSDTLERLDTLSIELGA